MNNRSQIFYIFRMKKFSLTILFLAAALFAEPAETIESVNADSSEKVNSLSDSAQTFSAGLAASEKDSSAVVSLAPAETCPSDSILSANYANCQQALKIVVNAQMDANNGGRDRSMEMARTAGSFLGGALIGFLIGWLLL
ncbi:hypothetical protein B0H50_11046 [Hallerella porci]|uniref:Uncharacterized protein n=2 Tax=Hallerella porci TaxID=1945871 RepID=A0ABX5LKU9_9BACT|nr:hypothetical protein B0H50_11046 [Hallerella porci]